MKIKEVTGKYIKSFTAQIRRAVNGMGSITARVEIKCDGLNQARYILARAYGTRNVFNIRETVDEGVGVISPKKPLTPDQFQVKSLQDQSKAIKARIKQVKAQQQIKKHQATLAKINKSPI
jgi:hypothetical protein